MEKFCTVISMIKKTYILLFVLLLANCSQNIFFVRTADVSFKPLKKNQFVKIFIKKQPNDFDEIGIIVVRGDNIETRYARAKEKARQVGGNALIVLAEKEKQSSYGSYRNKTGNFTDIKGRFYYYNELTPVTETNSYTEEKFLVIWHKDLKKK